MIDVLVVSALCFLSAVAGFGLAAFMIVHDGPLLRYRQAMRVASRVAMKAHGRIRAGLLPKTGDFFSMPPDNLRLLDDASKDILAVYYILNELDPNAGGGKRSESDERVRNLRDHAMLEEYNGENVGC